MNDIDLKVEATCALENIILNKYKLNINDFERDEWRNICDDNEYTLILKYIDSRYYESFVKDMDEYQKLVKALYDI
jgi:hypothetical protein